MEVMLSQRNKQLYVRGNFKFSFHKNLKDGIQRWKCNGKGCKAFIKISPDFTVIEANEQHTHAALDDQVLQRQQMSNNLKRKAVDDICTRPSKLVQQELKRGDSPKIYLSDISLIKKNIRRTRRLTFPKLPENRQEAISALQDLNARTNQGEALFSFADREREIAALSTESNIKLLSTSKKIYVDGTFRSCPKQFYQIFIIHAYLNERTIPVVYCLLPNKQSSTYKAAFQGVLEKCRELDCEFKPEEVYVDFETAIQQAVLEVWPSAAVRGCRFHLGQSWWKKIQSLGLAKEYSSKSETGTFLKLFFGLPFLPPDEVEDAFVYDLMTIQPDSEKVRDFCDYVLDNYVAEDATFPPKIWASFEATTNRTTNSCEAFHSRFNAQVPTPHPNVFVLMETINQIQCEVYVNIRTARANKSKSTKDKEDFLWTEMAKYKFGSQTRIEFIKAMSFKFLPVNF